MYGPLHLAFPGDVPYACTNIQQVAEEEEGEEGDIHIMEVDMMEFRMYKGCYPLSYDMIDICAQGGQIRRWHVHVRTTNSYCGFSMMEKNSVTFYLRCDHFRDMTNIGI